MEKKCFRRLPCLFMFLLSNVLSEAGRKLLGSLYPKIRTIASNYFSGDYAYVQEFEVAEDGIVEQPRIISGCDH